MTTDKITGSQAAAYYGRLMRESEKEVVKEVPIHGERTLAALPGPLEATLILWSDGSVTWK